MMKKAGKYLGCFCMLIVCYIISLSLIRLIPASALREHMPESYHCLEEEGIYGLGFDNYTDAIWLNTAITKYSDNILVDAVANAYVCLNEGEDSFDWLRAAMNGEGELKEYSRYWSGFQILYRPLLLFFALDKIRKILFVILLCLAAAVLFAVARDLGFRGIIPFLATIIWGNILHNGMCLSYFPDICLMLINMLAVHFMYKRRVSSEISNLCFFIMGSVCYFSNYFLFPLITLGMPLVYLTSLYMDEKNLKDIAVDVLTKSFLWSLSYVATLGVKIGLAKVLLPGTIGGAESVLFYLGGTYSIKGRIYFTLAFFPGKFSLPEIGVGLLITVLVLAIAIKNRKNRKTMPVWNLLMLAAYPVIWIFIFIGHCNHGFVRYILMVSIYAELSALLVLLEAKASLKKERKSGH